MTAIDTSVAIAAFAPWHESHEQALAAIDRDTVLPAHALTEVFATLTRMPEPFRMPAAVVADYLELEWGSRILTPESSFYRGLPERLAATGVHGGATYDAIIGLTASTAGHEILSLDLRADRTYRVLGIEYRLIA